VAKARGLLCARVAVGLAAAMGVVGAAGAAEFKLLAPNAAREAVSAAVAALEGATACRASVGWTGTEAITKRVSDGEAVDVVVNAAQNIDRQSRDGKLVAQTRTDFARSGIGVAVPASSARPDVSTTEALKSALLAARTVVVSSGTSGRHMVDVFGRLGVGEALKAKTKQPPSGAQIADFLASGEADLGFQQVSELLHAKGVHFLGPIPAELQSYTIYSAAVHAGAQNAACARELVANLRSGPVQSVVRSTGMEPL
jgi:molybdate transport system substrate-binding protein